MTLTPVLAPSERRVLLSRRRPAKAAVAPGVRKLAARLYFASVVSEGKNASRVSGVRCSRSSTIFRGPSNSVSSKSTAAANPKPDSTCSSRAFLRGFLGAFARRALLQFEDRKTHRLFPLGIPPHIPEETTVCRIIEPSARKAKAISSHSDQ